MHIAHWRSRWLESKPRFHVTIYQPEGRRTLHLTASLSQRKLYLAFCWRLIWALSLPPPTGELHHILSLHKCRKLQLHCFSVSWKFRAWFTPDHTPVGDERKSFDRWWKIPNVTSQMWAWHKADTRKDLVSSSFCSFLNTVDPLFS